LDTFNIAGTTFLSGAFAFGFLSDSQVMDLSGCVWCQLFISDNC